MVIMVAVKAAVIPAICPVQVGLCKLVRVEGSKGGLVGV